MTQEATLRKRSGYSAISNAAMSDRRISIEARGLLALLMTFSENWKFRACHLMKECAVGREKYFRMTGELKKFGYLTIENIHNEDGSFGGTIWTVTDCPDAREGQDICATAVPDNRSAENPKCAEPVLIRDNKEVRDNKSKNPPIVPPCSKRKTQIPDEWEPSADWLAAAEAHAAAVGLARAFDWPAEAKQFHAHHRARGNLMLDWRAAWTTWYCQACKFHRGPKMERKPKAMQAGSRELELAYE